MGMLARRPAVAGQFYPYDPRELARAVDAYIDESAVEPAPERVAAVVAPHAGYMYSGPTAGYAYARVKGKKPDRVILLGVSHRYMIEGASVYDSGEFLTPLGAFPVDAEFARTLIKDVGENAARSSLLKVPHLEEHALEVQLPFLWRSIGKVPIVPVLFGSPAGPFHVEFGGILAGMTSPRDLVVASTDLSHYLPQEQANEIDRRTLDTVLARDTGAVIEGLFNQTLSMCGGAGVVAAMGYATAAGATAWKLLDYRTSGDTSGDYRRVVGYAAVSMERH